MVPSLVYSSNGTVESPRSTYQPPQAVSQLVSIAQLDAQKADEILNRPFAEFNDMSLIQRTNLDKKDWLGYSPPQSKNPDEKWMFTGTSNITRAKILSMAAHLTSEIPLPKAFAQNDDDELDQAGGYVMTNAIEFNARDKNYEQTLLYGVIMGLALPVSYFEVDFVQSFAQRIEGTWDNFTKKQIIDEVMSGFQYAVYEPDEILLSNPYIFDIQQQPFIIKRNRISYDEARARYGHLEDFMHVTPGLVSIIDNDSGLFYDVDDTEENDSMVEESVLSYRGQDLEFPMINRIYMGNPNTEYNPFQHRTNKNDPRYKYAKYGAEPIDAKRFAYYKSIASKLANDKELLDRMRQNAVDASTFAGFPSILTMGGKKMDKSIFVPATVTEIGKDAKVVPATGLMNPEPLFRAAREVEQDINNASVDPRLSGVRSGPETARGGQQLQQNAINNLGILAKMIAFGMVKPIGELMVDNIIRYQSVGEMQQLAGGALGMKYMTMIINDKVIDGKKKSVVIRFTDRFVGMRLDEKELREKQVALFEEAGDDREIHEVNPGLWARRKFLIVVEPDILQPKNITFDASIRLEIYDRAIANQLIANDADALADVTRDFLFEPTVKGEGAKYLPKNPQLPTQEPGALPRKGIPSRIVEREAIGSETLL